METKEGELVSVENLEKNILDTTFNQFLTQGLNFTMNDIAQTLHIAKKTIYRFYDSKQNLLIALLDHAFADIQKEKQNILASDKPIAKRLEEAMIAMPKKYAKIDFGIVVKVKDTYPLVYKRLNEHLENNWEPIIELINEGIRKKEFRKINPYILREIVTASFEQFLYQSNLDAMHITYAKALKDMMSILMKGIAYDNA